jgi:hypothetical protein
VAELPALSGRLIEDPAGPTGNPVGILKSALKKSFDGFDKSV